MRICQTKINDLSTKKMNGFVNNYKGLGFDISKKFCPFTTKALKEV